MAGETTYANGYSTTAFKGHSRQLCVLDVTHEITAGELELADVIQFGKVPKGATYVGGFIATDDLDSNATPTLVLTVGDDDDVDGLSGIGTAGQFVDVAVFSGAYITNKTTTDSEKTILVKVDTAAATAAAGTIRVVLYYYTE